ncbi:MAG: hypothetical protein AMXMBFR82_29930 [Candidatus Hydrogenedentota bacterium]
MGKIIKSAEDKATNCSPFQRDALEHFTASSFTDDAGGFDPSAVIAEVQAEAEQIRQEAQEQGYADGVEAGQEAARQELASAIQGLAAASDAIRQSHEEYVANLEPEMLRLVRYITEQVIRREIRGDLDIVQNTIRAALKNVLDREHTVVHLNPEDLDALTEAGIDPVAMLSKYERLELAPDETVTRGGCVVESRTLSVDAQLDTQLQRIFEALTD